MRSRRPLRAALSWSSVCLGLLGAVAGASGPSASSAPPAVAADGKTLVVDVDGEIDLGLSSFFERVLGEAKAGDLVVLHVNTFGGRIDAAVQIRDDLLHSPARTVAFVDKRAISAGALISLACDEIIMSDGATIGAATPVQLEGGKMAPVEAKVVSYFRKEMKATAEAKGRRGDIAEAMVDASVVVDGLDGADTTLTLTTDEALKWKVASSRAQTLAEVLHHYDKDEPASIKPGLNWAERVARFLSDSTISSLLMTLGMLGILIELWSPGHAVAGVVGVLCLLLFFFGHYVVHLAGWEEILLFLVGIALVGFEVFFWPGHGALAVLGVIFVVASLTMALVNTHAVPLDVSWSLGWVPRALTMVFGSVLATAVLMAIVTRFLPSTPLGRRLILSGAITASASPSDAQTASLGGLGGESLVGAPGVAETALRPAGKIALGGRRLDVVSDGEFIDAGAPVVVVSVAAGRIVVRRQA